MGSSAKKKREKKKDFQKPKFKVGTARPKAANQTDTNFRSRAIVLNQQSLHVSAPAASSQFLHHMSFLSSRSDSQRRDSLAYLTSCISSRSLGSSLPQALSTILPRIYPLILDSNGNVRQQSLKLLRALPSHEMSDHVPEILPYVRAGMTHLAADLRIFSIEVLSWLLDLAPHEVVSCGGGWIKTLNCFLALLGWYAQDSAAWSSNRVFFGNPGGDGKLQARNLQVLAEFLGAGLRIDVDSSLNTTESHRRSSFPLYHTDHHELPKRSNAYAYLSLFGSPKDDDVDMLEDREDRIRVFKDRYAPSFENGLVSARRDGGEVGRAAGLVTKGMKSAELS